MARKKWDVAPKLDFETLNWSWELDLTTYIKKRVSWGEVPKTIKNIVIWLVSTGDYYLDWLVLKKKIMTDNEPYAWVEQLK